MLATRMSSSEIEDVRLVERFFEPISEGHAGGLSFHKAILRRHPSEVGEYGH